MSLMHRVRFNVGFSGATRKVLERASDVMIRRVIDLVILIFGVLSVQFAHGIFEYFGVILAALLLIVLNHTIARKRRRAVSADRSPK
jgi:hypothetical protein